MRRIAETGNVYMDSNAASITNAADSASVSLSKTYDNPVVVAHTATNSGSQPVDDRVTNVTSNGFDLFAVEPDSQGHNNNTHTYIVAEQGAWLTPEENPIEAGIHKTETTGPDGDYVSFDYDWNKVPVVLATVNTHNNQEFSTPAISNVTADGFYISQLTEGSPTAIEDIGWIALPPITSQLDGNLFDAGTTTNGSVSWGQSYSNSPDYVADINTYSGSDPHWLRGGGTWNNSGASWYSESGGSIGTVGYAAIEQLATIQGRPATGDGTGTLLYQTVPESFEGGLGAEWSTVNTLTTDTDRVYSGSTAGRNNTAPSGNVLATFEPSEINGGSQISSFEVFYQETSAQTGHAFNFYDSSDNRILSVGSENPQFWIWDADGDVIRPNSTGNIDAYDTWLRVTIWFNWSDGKYKVELARPSDGARETVEGSLILNTDVASIDVAQNVPSTGRGGSADDLWLDNIAVNNDTDIREGYSTTNDSTGGVYSGPSDHNTSVEEHPTEVGVTATDITSNVATAATETAPQQSATALNVVGNVATVTQVAANVESASGSTFAADSTGATASVTVSDGALAAVKRAGGSTTTTAQASIESASATPQSVSGISAYDGPGTVTATVNSNDSITVNWTKTNAEADQYHVQMSRDGSSWTDPASGATTSASNTSLTVYHESDNGYNEVVGIDSSFRFRVRTEGSGTSSGWNSSGKVYTDPIPPHNPSVSRPDANTFDITFTVKGDATNEVNLYYREDTGSGYGSWINWGTLNGNETETDADIKKGNTVTASFNTTDHTFQKNSRYQFRLTADAYPSSKTSEPTYADYGNNGNVYFSDDFESGDISAWDSSYGGHSVGTGSYADTGVSGADQGTYYLQGYGKSSTEASWVQKNLGDLSNETDVLVKCAFAIGSLDNSSENFNIEWYDGSTWQILTEFHCEYNEQGWFEVSEVVPDSWLSTDSRIRIGDTTSSGMYSGDYFAVDRVVVSDILHEYTQPADVTNITVTPESNTELSVQWNNPSPFHPTDEVNYHDSGGTEYKDFDVNNESYTITGLENDSQYDVYVLHSFNQYRHGSKDSISGHPHYGPVTESTLDYRTSTVEQTVSSTSSQSVEPQAISAGGSIRIAETSPKTIDARTETASAGLTSASTQTSSTSASSAETSRSVAEVSDGREAIAEVYPNTNDNSPDTGDIYNGVVEYHKFDALRGVLSWGDYYVQRIRGTLKPPETGTYYFWLSGDNEKAFYLDGSKILGGDFGWTSWKEWDKYPSDQKSSGIHLEAGKEYTFELYNNEKSGGDHVEVGWRKPSDGDGTLPVGLVPGQYLKPRLGSYATAGAPYTEESAAASQVASTTEPTQSRSSLVEVAQTDSASVSPNIVVPIKMMEGGGVNKIGASPKTASVGTQSSSNGKSSVVSSPNLALVDTTTQSPSVRASAGGSTEVGESQTSTISPGSMPSSNTTPQQSRSSVVENASQSSTQSISSTSNVATTVTAGGVVTGSSSNEVATSTNTGATALVAADGAYAVATTPNSRTTVAGSGEIARTSVTDVGLSQSSTQDGSTVSVSATTTVANSFTQGKNASITKSQTTSEIATGSAFTDVARASAQSNISIETVKPQTKTTEIAEVATATGTAIDRIETATTAASGLKSNFTHITTVGSGQTTTAAQGVVKSEITNKRPKTQVVAVSQKSDSKVRGEIAFGDAHTQTSGIVRGNVGATHSVVDTTTTVDSTASSASVSSRVSTIKSVSTSESDKAKTHGQWLDPHVIIPADKADGIVEILSATAYTETGAGDVESSVSNNAFSISSSTSSVSVGANEAVLSVTNVATVYTGTASVATPNRGYIASLGRVNPETATTSSSAVANAETVSAISNSTSATVSSGVTTGKIVAAKAYIIPRAEPMKIEVSETDSTQVNSSEAITQSSETSTSITPTTTEVTIDDG